MANAVLIKGEKGQGTDELSDALVSIDTRTNRIHRGQSFRAGTFVLALADDGLIEILIKVGINVAHVTFVAAAGGDAQIEIFESTTVSADGSALSIGNRDRGSANTPTMTVFSGPTITGDGNELVKILLPGGTGGNAGGGAVQSPLEFILKASTNYLARIKNISGGAKPFSASIDFYEPDV